MIITLPSIITIVAVVGVLSILGAIALFIYSVLKREREFQEKEKHTFTEYQRILDQAHEQAKDLLEKTTISSENILKQTRSTNENLAADLDKILQQVALRHIQELNTDATNFKNSYQNKVVQMQTTIDQNTKSMIQTAQDGLNKHLETFSQTLLKKATTSGEVIDQKTKERLGEVEKEVETYKTAKMAKLDTQMVELIQRTYQDILGKSIPPDVHEEMIFKALEKSKKEGVFDV